MKPGMKTHPPCGDVFQHLEQHCFDGLKLKRLVLTQEQGVTPLNAIKLPTFRSDEVRYDFRRRV